MTTRETLDSMNCAECGRGADCDDPLYMHSHCHPKSPTWAVYHNGLLRISCAKCGKLIIEVGVV